MLESGLEHTVASPPLRVCLDIIRGSGGHYSFSQFSASDAMPTVRVGQDVLARDKRGTWYAAKVMAALVTLCVLGHGDRDGARRTDGDAGDRKRTESRLQSCTREQACKTCSD